MPDSAKVAASAPADSAPPDKIVIAGLDDFPIARHVIDHQGMPLVDWSAVSDWISATSDASRQAEAWDACERAWLQRLRDALGSGYRLVESEHAALLSSLDSNVARATLDFMERTLRRVSSVLDGIAVIPPWGKDILIVFDDHDKYYGYVSFFYPEDGVFARSSGMHISHGCSHYVTVKSDLHQIEPVIAHEMTHGCLGHLPIPLWLNEGIAVNTEHRLVGSGSPLHTPQQMWEKHRVFWRAGEMQEFWSGKSFYRADDGNMLSYDLARLMVEHMAKDWDNFKSFVLAAHEQDAGAAAAREHFKLDLGAFAAALLGRKPGTGWAPDPNAWMTKKDPQ